MKGIAAEHKYRKNNEIRFFLLLFFNYIFLKYIYFFAAENAAEVSMSTLWWSIQTHAKMW